MRRFALLLLAACATAPPPNPPPWRSAPLRATDVPAVYAEQWRRAENRTTCAILAPGNLGEAGAGATPRAATFSGGWGVAYDLPNVRSAFGIAGAGVRVDSPSYADWPHTREWFDGSRAEYGPEGGTGPNQLAYVKVQGQDCLYNVWSRLGREHLEYLIGQLRFVDGAR